jgi:hypothetical protein
MPRGPNGEKRPADAIGCAIAVARIAIGDAEDECLSAPGRQRSGIAGAKARAENLSSERRSEIAKAAAAKRWR